MKKLNIAIIGQGRSGRDIHGKFFKSEDNTKFNVVAVVDRDEERRERAKNEYPGCEAYASYTELYGRNDIDVVLNSTISNEHYAVSKDILNHGFNLIVEKPFARTRYECDELINLAREKGVKIAVFQQSFFAPFYEYAKEVVASGKLGEIKPIDITYNNFARRWDWQTTQVKLGGNAYNTGPHPVGLALGFLDFDDDARVVYSKLDRVLNSGDSDDYAKILVTAPGKPLVDIEISSNDAYPAANIKLLGSKGTYKSTISDYEMKYIADGENPEKTLVLDSMKNDEGYPCYCTEKLITHEESGSFVGTPFDVGTKKFYDMIYAAVTENAEMQVKAEHAAKIISIIETAHAENPMPVKF